MHKSQVNSVILLRLAQERLDKANKIITKKAL